MDSIADGSPGSYNVPGLLAVSGHTMLNNIGFVVSDLLGLGSYNVKQHTIVKHHKMLKSIQVSLLSLVFRSFDHVIRSVHDDFMLCDSVQ